MMKLLVRIQTVLINVLSYVVYEQNKNATHTKYAPFSPHYNKIRKVRLSYF